MMTVSPVLVCILVHLSEHSPSRICCSVRIRSRITGNPAAGCPQIAGENRPCRSLTGTGRPARITYDMAI